MARAKATARSFVSTPEQRAAATRSLHVVPGDEERRRQDLLAYVPKNGTAAPPALRDVMVGLVLATPFTNAKRDLDLLATGLDNAAYDLLLHGAYDPGRAMSEAGLAQWRKDALSRRGLSESSQGDYISRVRFIAKNTGYAPHLTERSASPRGVPTPPASKRAWALVVEKAQRLPLPLRADMTMLADLTFGEGCRADEAARAQARDLILLNNGDAKLRIVNRHGVLREVPVGPLVTSRILQAQRQPEEYLLRPRLDRSPNLVNRLQEAAHKRVPNVRFNVNAARNRYIVDLLSQPLPFRVICEIADLNGGGHTAQDLARFADLPNSAAILEMVRGTWK